MSCLLVGSFLFIGTFCDASEKTKDLCNSGDSKLLLDVDRAINLAATYIETATSKQGKFTYQVEIDNGSTSPSYNILRHAGTMYALATLQELRPEPHAANALLHATKFLQAGYVAPVAHGDLQAVWSEARPHSSIAELGGTGLGLLALAGAHRLDRSAVSLDQMEALGRFLLFMQKPNGDFIHKYTRSEGPITKFRSLYYPGEAAMGLISLYEVNRSPVWLNAASRALGFLAKARENETSVPRDSWALIATARLLPYCANTRCPVSREVLVKHAIQISRQLLNQQQVSLQRLDIEGAFDKDGRTAPTATSLEGLLAALEFLPESEKSLKNEIRLSAQRGVIFLVRSQIRSGPYMGGIPRVPTFISETRNAIRIDYVQHALSAWIRYVRLQSCFADKTP